MKGFKVLTRGASISICLALALVLGSSAAAKAQTKVSVRVTTDAAAWVDQSSKVTVSTYKEGDAYDAEIYLDSPKQVINGFGGCINEKGWEALSVLSAKDREAVLAALFDPKTGARFTMARVPIGASDYAVSRYTLDEVADDFDMKSFSIERDKQYLIPFIKAAMKYAPKLRLWGSAWTPPTWMKTNKAFDKGSMRDEPAIYKAYALYLLKFAQAYKALGLDLFAVCPQNEPIMERNYPTCAWEPKQFLTFIRDFAGPLFASSKGPELWCATINDQSIYDRVKPIMDDPEAAKYIKGFGYQWDGSMCVLDTYENWPAIPIYQSEIICGNNYWEAGYNPDMPPNDFEYGQFTWTKVRDFIADGAAGNFAWNMVLDTQGKSIDSEAPWAQNALIVVDRAKKSVKYTAAYYAFKHFSLLIAPGARYMESDQNNYDSFIAEKLVAFKNPDGSLVIEYSNPQDSENEGVIVKIGDKLYKLPAPLSSMASALIAP